MAVQIFTPSNACVGCGACCRMLPGQFLPSDLGETVGERKAKARELLLSGSYSIDWWEGDVDPAGDLSRVVHLRPATMTGRGFIFEASWGGTCVMLGDNGCTLPRDQMPFVCKALEPTADRSCHNGMSKEDVARAWRGDHDWLEELGRHLLEETGHQRVGGTV